MRIPGAATSGRRPEPFGATTQMMARKLIVAGGLLVIGGVAGWALRTPLPPSGVGQYRDSPDGKWVARAESLSDGPIIGPSRTYGSFTILKSSPRSQAIRRVLLEDTAVPAIDWREDGSILWETNSGSVTFLHAGPNGRLEITLVVPP